MHASATERQDFNAISAFLLTTPISMKAPIKQTTLDIN